MIKLPSNRTVIDFDTFRKLRFGERLKILLGFNLKVTSTVHIHRRAARVFGKSVVTLTKETSAEGQLKETL